MKPYVFISYSADTESYARQLTLALERADVRTWVAFRDLGPGARWSDEIEKAIQESDWFVILAKSGAESTPYQDLEWRRALTGTWENPKKRILPVIFGTGKIAPFQGWVPLNIQDPEVSPEWTEAVCDVLKLRAGAQSLSAERTEPGRASDKLWTMEIAEHPVAKV